jgi:hypothetical protein
MILGNNGMEIAYSDLASRSQRRDAANSNRGQQIKLRRIEKRNFPSTPHSHMRRNRYVGDYIT